MPNFISYPPPARSSGHGRTLSQASSQSTHSARSTQSAPNLPTPTMEGLMRTIAQAPRGSKIAQDAAKALIVAERERRARTGVRLSPIPSPRMPLPHPEPSPGARIGARVINDNLEEDPFDLDVPEDIDASETESGQGADAPSFTAHPGGTSQWPLVPAYPPPVAELENVTGIRQGGYDYLIGGQEHVLEATRRPLLLRDSEILPIMLQGVAATQAALAIFWRGPNPQRFAIVTDRTGPTGTDDTFPLTVAGNHTQIIEMPKAWTGFVQRLSDDLNTPATRAHIAFDAYRAFSFFYVSYIHGNNGPILARAEPGGEQAGSRFLALDVAPSSILGEAPNKTPYILPTWYGPNHRRDSIVRFYRNFLNAPLLGAVLAEDETAATQVTRDRHIVLDFA